jgi:hypothetical protein
VFDIKYSYHLDVNVKGKGRVVRVFFSTEYHAMKAYWGSGGISPRILDLGTRWRVVASFTPREGAHVTDSIGGWVGPRIGLDAVTVGLWLQ